MHQQPSHVHSSKLQGCAGALTRAYLHDAMSGRGWQGCNWHVHTLPNHTCENLHSKHAAAHNGVCAGGAVPSPANHCSAGVGAAGVLQVGVLLPHPQEPSWLLMAHLGGVAGEADGLLAYGTVLASSDAGGPQWGSHQVHAGR